MRDLALALRLLLGLNFANEELGTRWKQHCLSCLCLRERFVSKKLSYLDAIDRVYVEYHILPTTRVLFEYGIRNLPYLR